MGEKPDRLALCPCGASVQSGWREDANAIREKSRRETRQDRWAARASYGPSHSALCQKITLRSPCCSHRGTYSSMGRRAARPELGCRPPCARVLGSWARGRLRQGDPPRRSASAGCLLLSVFRTVNQWKRHQRHLRSTANQLSIQLIRQSFFCT